MAYSAKAIANEFLRLAANDGRSIDHLGLQKFVYLAHAWHLALTNDCLTKENPEAWTHGPVYPSIYREFRGSGARSIDRYAVDFPGTTPFIPETDQNARAVIAQVWKKYCRYTSVQLSVLTHKSGSPWQQAIQQGKNTEIEPDTIKKHYQGILESRVEQ